MSFSFSDFSEKALTASWIVFVLVLISALATAVVHWNSPHERCVPRKMTHLLMGQQLFSIPAELGPLWAQPSLPSSCASNDFLQVTRFSLSPGKSLPTYIVQNGSYTWHPHIGVSYFPDQEGLDPY